MSKIDDLLAKMCPKGVIRLPISDLCTTFSGGFIKKTKQDISFEFPVYNGGAEPTGFYEEFNSPADSIAISGRGSIGFVNWVSTKFWAGNSCHVVQANKMELNNKFLYYYLKHHEVDLRALKNTGSIPALNLGPLLKFLIPLPPLEIQKEIVAILDKFTELEAELEAELEVRKIQYRRYLERLTTQESNTTDLKLSKVFDLRNGYTPSKANSDYWENGTIPWFRLEDIKKNGRILNSALQTVHQSALKGSGTFPENSIMISVSATIGEHALVTVPFIANQRFIVLTIKPDLATAVLPKYAFYCAFDIANYCKKITTLGNFSGVDMKQFNNYLFKIPTLQNQIRNIAILDCFVDLISSIELEKSIRRQQYEYYRNKLLTFKELDVA